MRHRQVEIEQQGAQIGDDISDRAERPDPGRARRAAPDDQNADRLQQYHEWSVSSGAQTIAAMMAEPIARWLGAILVSVPASAMMITAPIEANSQPPPLIRTISDIGGEDDRDGGGDGQPVIHRLLPLDLGRSPCYCVRSRAGAGAARRRRAEWRRQRWRRATRRPAVPPRRPRSQRAARTPGQACLSSAAPPAGPAPLDSPLWPRWPFCP